jgi:hypothetical protein
MHVRQTFGVRARPVPSVFRRDGNVEECNNVVILVIVVAVVVVAEQGANQ